MTIGIRRYSGEGRSGICKCGHNWDEHHLGVVMNREHFESTKEAYVPQECEHYGCNEEGGLMPGPDGEMIDHCFGYTDSLEDEDAKV
jgi:hypothetical protein